MTLSRAGGSAALASASFLVSGGARAPIAVAPTLPIAAGELVSVQIAGRLGGYRPDDTAGGFEFGWATAF